MNSKKAFAVTAFMAVSLSPALGSAAETTYKLDKVTAVTMDSAHPSVSGVEKGTGNALTVSFVDNTNESYRYVVSRCIPLIMTVLEKPNRYSLTLVVDSSDTNVQLRSCRIDVK